MKLTFKTLLLSACFFIRVCHAAPLAVISGDPLAWQKKVTRRFLAEKMLDHPFLVQWDLENKTCQKRSKTLLQLCFYQGDLFVINLKKKKLRQTLGVLVKPQKPSLGGP